MASVQAGWYAPDPDDPHAFRYWDGTSWTEHEYRSESPAVPQSTVTKPDATPAARAGASSRSWGCATWLVMAVLVLGVVIGFSVMTGDGGGALGGVIVVTCVSLAIGWLRARRAVLRADIAPPKDEVAAPADHPRRNLAPTPTREVVHRAPPPTGQVLEPWGRPSIRLEVVGESYRDDAFRKLFQGVRIDGYDGAEMHLDAVLVDDSGNPYDSNAVAIWVAGLHLGYLDRESARTWHQTVRELKEQELQLTVPARIWAAARGSRVNARVTLSMPDPHAIGPANDVPSADHVVLPRGSTIQVTKEDEHMDVLKKYVGDAPVPIAVTLHAIYEMRARSAPEAVEVRLDGERVGILSPVQSANLLPLVKFVDARNKVSVARATLTGNALKADIALDVAKAQEVDAAWMQAQGPELPKPPRVVRPAYEWDEDDPAPPTDT